VTEETAPPIRIRRPSHAPLVEVEEIDRHINRRLALAEVTALENSYGQPRKAPPVHRESTPKPTLSTQIASTLQEIDALSKLTERLNPAPTWTPENIGAMGSTITSVIGTSIDAYVKLETLKAQKKAIAEAGRTQQPPQPVPEPQQQYQPPSQQSADESQMVEKMNAMIGGFNNIAQSNKELLAMMQAQNEKINNLEKELASKQEISEAEDNEVVPVEDNQKKKTKTEVKE